MHLLSTALLLLLIILLRYWSFPNLIPIFILGGLVGVILPDIDHLIYALYLHPKDLSSQRVQGKLAQKQWREVISLLYVTRNERRDLIFHNAFFQSLFAVFSFLVVTSSNSIFGKGLVICFLLHLLADEYRDMRFKAIPEEWFSKIPLSIFSEKRNMQFFFLFQVLVLLSLSFIF